VPRIFVPPERLDGDRVTLTGEAHKHLAKVLRLQEGDDVLVFDGRGHEIEARVASVGARQIDLALGARRALAAPPVAITLLQAVPRGERMDLLVQKTTELGVAAIVPVIAQRSVARPPAGRARRWQTIASEAARQSGRADVPVVAEVLELDAALSAAKGMRLLLWEEERGTSLRAALEKVASEVALLVGPEGGWTAEEVEAARRAGFVPVGLGPRVLRVETAAIVAVALVQAAAGGLE
jgi:16S rRNA (uracil1498-N3)-methyltransferase